MPAKGGDQSVLASPAVARDKELNSELGAMPNEEGSTTKAIIAAQTQVFSENRQSEPFSPVMEQKRSLP